METFCRSLSPYIPLRSSAESRLDGAWLWSFSFQGVYSCWRAGLCAYQRSIGVPLLTAMLLACSAAPLTADRLLRSAHVLL